MRLKVATTTAFLFGVGLLLAWPLIVGRQPAHSHTRALAAYTLRFGFYVTVLVIVFFTVVVLAAAVARKARDEYREESRRNLEALIEGTLRAHGRNAGGEQPDRNE